MTPTLTFAPSPCPPGYRGALTGKGFNNRTIRISVDATGYSKRIFAAIPDGSFAVGVTPKSKPGSAIITAEQEYPTGVWTKVAELVVQVVEPPVDPPDPPPPPPPPPPVASGMYTAVYGSGIEADSKDNFQIGWLAKQRVSYRFRASSTDLLALAVNLRGGPNPYSGGDGGIVRLTVHPDDGHGKPNETVTLGSMSFHPGNPAGNWEHFDFWAFISTVKLVKGELYHVVFANTASAQTTNWVSLNATTTLSGKRSPRQPAFTDDFALLYNKGSGWKGPGDAPGANNADPAEKTPVIDLVYADGTHDGNGYYQATVSEYAVIGGQNRVRQTFTPKKAFSATRASFRVKRHQGIGPVTMDIYRGSTKIASAVVAGSGIPATDYPVPVGDNHWDGNSLAGGRWLDMVFPQIDFQANVAYSYELSAPTGTIYIAIPIREIGATEHATWGARLFRDGQAEQSSNGGSSWVAAYPAPHDWQFYFADLAA